MGQPLRGELTLPSRAQFEPLAPAGRLQWLMGQISHLNLRSPLLPTPPRLTSGTQSVDDEDQVGLPKLTIHPAEPELPIPLGLEWKMSEEEIEQAERCLLPYALLNAAGRSDGSLQELISSGLPPATLHQRSPSCPSNLLGQTLVHIAAFYGLESNLEILLDHGASVHLRDDLGHTPLFYAIRKGHLGCIDILKKAGGHLVESELDSLLPSDGLV